LWKEGGIPLRELREEYTYEDLLKANAVLDMYADMDTAMSALIREESKPKGADR
jgi:hypothetical protein